MAETILQRLSRRARRVVPGPAADGPPPITREPHLIPPASLMREEGVEVLEEWFRWAEEWSLLLRAYGGITRESAVLEIGCGLGRIAFPLRCILYSPGRYEGFDICRNKIDFLQDAFREYPHFHFTWADVHNTQYHPQGRTPAAEYRFPYPPGSFDVVYAASVFTHMLPEAAASYFQQASQVLAPGGRCLFSFFLLDLYRPGAPRPPGFASRAFDFDHRHGGHGDDFAIVDPGNPEFMTAYRTGWIERAAERAGLELAREPVPGHWSGSTETWVGLQDLVVLRKPSPQTPPSQG